MILLIDNYDSFVFNLARYVTEHGVAARVVRNDAVSVSEVISLKPDAIILSPGPCTPEDAGICVELVRKVAGLIPVLGVCLGHQAIAAALGADVIRAPEPVHGRTSAVTHDGTRLFAGLPSPLRVTRYHSLIVKESSLPGDLKVTSQTDDGLVMAVEHQKHAVFGVQFHPESILTQMGHDLIRNYLNLAAVQTPLIPKGDSLGAAGIGQQVATELESANDQRWVDNPDQPLHW